LHDCPSVRRSGSWLRFERFVLRAGSMNCDGHRSSCRPCARALPIPGVLRRRCIKRAARAGDHVSRLEMKTADRFFVFARCAFLATNAQRARARRLHELDAAPSVYYGRLAEDR
jgi:hypothetical protein